MLYVVQNTRHRIEISQNFANNFHVYHHMSCTQFWMLRGHSLQPQSCHIAKSNLYTRQPDTGKHSHSTKLRSSCRAAESEVAREQPQNPTSSVRQKQPKRTGISTSWMSCVHYGVCLSLLQFPTAYPVALHCH